VSGGPVQIRFEAGRDGRRLVHLLEGVGEALLEEVDVAPPGATQLEELAGNYSSDELDVTWTVSPAGGGLEVAMSRSRAGFEVWPSIPDFFLSEDRVLEFERDAEGSVTGLRVHSERVRNLRFVRQP
jgi:hypothetical protein